MRNRTEIKNELIIDTNNFTEEVMGWNYNTAFDGGKHYDEIKEEALYVIAQLKKHYKYVDYYIGDKGYYIYASNTINYDEHPCDVNYQQGQ